MTSNQISKSEQEARRYCALAPTKHHIQVWEIGDLISWGFFSKCTSRQSSSAVSIALHLAAAIIVGACTTMYLVNIYLGANRLLVFELLNNTLLIVLRVSTLVVGATYKIALLVFPGANARLVVINASVGIAFAVIPALISGYNSIERMSAAGHRDVPTHYRPPFIVGAAILLLSLFLLLFTLRTVLIVQVEWIVFAHVLVSVIFSFAVTLTILSAVGIAIVFCAAKAVKSVTSLRR
jgi:hypothetical protein